MNTRIRHLTALGLTAAGLAAPVALVAPAAHAATTDTCYQLVVQDVYRNPTLISYYDQINSMLKSSGFSYVWSSADTPQEQALVCGNGIAIRSQFGYEEAVKALNYTPVKSTQDQYFSYRVPADRSGAVIIPERSQMFLAITEAQEAGLEIVGNDNGKLVVKGNPSTVYALWSYWRVTSLGTNAPA